MPDLSVRAWGGPQNRGDQRSWREVEQQSTMRLHLMQVGMTAVTADGDYLGRWNELQESRADGVGLSGEKADQHDIGGEGREVLANGLPFIKLGNHVQGDATGYHFLDDICKQCRYRHKDATKGHQPRLFLSSQEFLSIARSEPLAPSI